MGIFDKMKKKGQQLLNQTFLDATLSACVLVGYADGNLSGEERTKILGAVRRNDDLSCFTEAEVIERFESICDDMEFDFSIGKVKCLDKIKKLAGKDEDAKMCATIVVAVAKADGDFDRDEKKVFTQICQILNVNTSLFD